MLDLQKKWATMNLSSTKGEDVMADTNLIPFQPCVFDRGPTGNCGSPSDNGWCTNHEGAMCVACGKHAVRACDHTGPGILMCGAPLCEECGHEPHDDNKAPIPPRHLNKTELAALERPYEK